MQEATEAIAMARFDKPDDEDDDEEAKELKGDDHQESVFDA